MVSSLPPHAVSLATDRCAVHVGCQILLGTGKALHEQRFTLPFRHIPPVIWRSSLKTANTYWQRARNWGTVKNDAHLAITATSWLHLSCCLYGEKNTEGEKWNDQKSCQRNWLFRRIMLEFASKKKTVFHPVPPLSPSSVGPVRFCLPPWHTHTGVQGAE